VLDGKSLLHLLEFAKIPFDFSIVEQRFMQSVPYLEIKFFVSDEYQTRYKVTSACEICSAFFFILLFNFVKVYYHHF
jgi:hypothetical protein